MDNEFTQKAIEQAFQQAENLGECSMHFFIISVILIVAGIYIMNKYIYESKDIYGLISIGIGLMFFLISAETSLNAKKAKETPELYIMEKFGTKGTESHYVPINVR